MSDIYFAEVKSKSACYRIIKRARIQDVLKAHFGEKSWNEIH